MRAIWEGYAGWFHQRSTTELYPIPASEVHPDVVALAGGAAAVAGLALARLERGEAVPLVDASQCRATVRDTINGVTPFSWQAWRLINLARWTQLL